MRRRSYETPARREDAGAARLGCGRSGAGLQPWATVVLPSDQGVGGWLEVAAVGLPAGDALAFVVLVTLEVTGYRRCLWGRVLGPVRGPIVRRQHAHLGVSCWGWPAASAP